jgi:hypothetical protein
MYSSKILVSLLLIIACSPIRPVTKNNPPLPEKIYDVDELIAIRHNYITETFSRIDTLLALLFETPPPHTHCEAYENILFKELSFYYYANIECEDYIFPKILRPKIAKNGNKWIESLMLVPKRDCEGDNVWRLRMLPRILMDTTSTDNSFYLLGRIERIIQEPCATTLKVLQNDVEWRKNLFNSMLVQIEFIENNPIENSGPMLGLDDVYWLMNELPDRSTSKFAFDFVMMHDSIPSEIQDIIGNRMYDWGVDYANINMYGYSSYAGEPIIYSDSELILLVERLNYIQSIRKCDWCSHTVSSIHARLKRE